MFNQHQNNTWKEAFTNRNLVAWSAAPLLLFPSRYTGDDGYFSDTEESDTITIFGNNFAVIATLHGDVFIHLFLFVVVV